MSSLVDYRRALHRIPELDCQLPETLALVRSVLEPLPYDLSSPIPGSVCACLDAGKPETAVFRADMDALPVSENTGLPFASAHPGIMHACGHDGHTAMALALAEYAAAHRAELPRNVLLLFQPAEETSGGAGPLCETGILKKYRAARVFGLHLWPGLPKGRIFSRPGPMMARSNEVTVTVTGHSVHLSRASEGRDALAAGVEFYRRARELADGLPPSEPRVLGFGRMISGTVRNAVSGSTVLEGSLRTYREETYLCLRKGLEDLGTALAAETGCGIDVHLSDGYPAVWNHEDLYEAICRGLGPHAPEPLESPALAAEDFSFYQREIPGVFFFLGLGDVPELHAPEFCFDDEAVLPAGVSFLKRLLLLP